MSNEHSKRHSPESAPYHAYARLCSMVVQYATAAHVLNMRGIQMLVLKELCASTLARENTMEFAGKVLPLEVSSDELSARLSDEVDEIMRQPLEGIIDEMERRDLTPSRYILSFGEQSHFSKFSQYKESYALFKEGSAQGAARVAQFRADFPEVAKLLDHSLTYLTLRHERIQRDVDKRFQEI